MMLVRAVVEGGVQWWVVEAAKTRRSAVHRSQFMSAAWQYSHELRDELVIVDEAVADVMDDVAVM